MALASAAASSARGSLCTLIALNIILGFITARSARLERLVAGSPVLLRRDGEGFAEVLRAQHIGRGEVDSALRQAD